MKRLTCCILLASLFLVGCFETTLNLGPIGDAKVDPAYCGDWHFTWKDGDKEDSAELVIRNFDGKQYYVEWKESGEKVIRMSGFLVPVKDAMFAQLSSLDEKSDTHLIARVDLKGDKLTLRHLKKDFFSEVTTDAQLRERVEKNLDNAEMYDETSTGSRVPQP